VRVVAPNRLMWEAAEILGPVRDEVTVFGALAVQIALDGHDVALALTSDVDAGLPTEAVDDVVEHLESKGFRRGGLDHERAFTWVQGDIKVQLIRPFHPFPKGAAQGLPENNLVARLDQLRWPVAFDGEPDKGRFWAAKPAVLVALKESAFGRTRPDGEPVRRDFSDVALLLDRLGEEIVAEIHGDHELQTRVTRAAERLTDDEAAIAVAASELVSSGHDENQLAAERAVRRAGQRFSRLLEH
jgi:hypothetical protein